MRATLPPFPADLEALEKKEDDEQADESPHDKQVAPGKDESLRAHHGRRARRRKTALDRFAQGELFHSPSTDDDAVSDEDGRDPCGEGAVSERHPPQEI